MGSGLPLESNGCRVLTRVGFGREQKNYAAMYRSIEQALEAQLPHTAPALASAHLLLRIHGKEICKTNGPNCGECCAVDLCAYATKAGASSPQPINS